MIWQDKSIIVDPPKRPKKITATRFATILGLNPWSTAFEMFCEITKTYQKPFKDTIYTLAGKIIEPKQIAYMRKAYVMTNLRTPTDVYGENYFNKTWGDFFHDFQILKLIDDREAPHTPHNTPLLYGSQCGVLSFLTVCFLLLYPLILQIRNLRKKPGQDLLLYGILTASAAAST